MMICIHGTRLDSNLSPPHGNSLHGPPALPGELYGHLPLLIFNTVLLLLQKTTTVCCHHTFFSLLNGDDEEKASTSYLK